MKKGQGRIMIEQVALEQNLTMHQLRCTLQQCSELVERNGRRVEYESAGECLEFREAYALDPDRRDTAVEELNVKDIRPISSHSRVSGLWSTSSTCKFGVTSAGSSGGGLLKECPYFGQPLRIRRKLL